MFVGVYKLNANMKLIECFKFISQKLAIAEVMAMTKRWRLGDEGGGELGVLTNTEVYKSEY